MANKNKPLFFKLSSTLIAFTLFIYIIVLIYITLFAWNYGSSFGPLGPGGRNYNIEPFLSIYNIATYSPDLVDPIRILVGNILLFIPFGLLFPLLFEKVRPSKKVTGIILTGFFAMLLSISIEVNQFLFTYRVANIDDVILNTLGGIVGAVIYRIFKVLRIM